MAAQNERPIIIVKKRKKGGGGHHGGAWKVAYADFVTAMMAFFLVMWLVTAVSKDQRAAIFDYFKNPSMEQGKSSKPAPGQMGPGGASTSPINLGGGLDSPRVRLEKVKDIGATTAVSKTKGTHGKDGGESDQQAKQQVAEAEHKKLESLMLELREAISKSQALEPFKDQLLLDITPEGIRIQIVDAQNRPMFDIGSAHLRDYTQSILHELAPYLSSVPNRISITGHTDVRPYPGQGYSNWELSADRANAARRALVNAGLPDEKIARVVGLSSSVLFDKQDPQNAINRRISIVIMTKQAEEDALKTDEAKTEPQGPVAAPPLTMPEDAVPVGTAPVGPMPVSAAPASGTNSVRTSANTAQASSATTAYAAPLASAAPTSANTAQVGSAAAPATAARTAYATPAAANTAQSGSAAAPANTTRTAYTTPASANTAAAPRSAAPPTAAAQAGSSTSKAIQAAVAAVKGTTAPAK
jgi:chemotaxis protein MotB